MVLPRLERDDQEAFMTVLADPLGFDPAHTMTLTFVPLLVGLVAAAFAMLRHPGRTSDLMLSSGMHRTGRVWDIRHGWRHRRPSWMTDRRAKWAGRPERSVKPLRPALVFPR
jgi:hypothetical protein